MVMMILCSSLLLLSRVSLHLALWGTNLLESSDDGRKKILSVNFNLEKEFQVI